MDMQDFIAKYEGLEAGQQLTDVVVSLAGGHACVCVCAHLHVRPGARSSAQLMCSCQVASCNMCSLRHCLTPRYWKEVSAQTSPLHVSNGTVARVLHLGLQLVKHPLQEGHPTGTPSRHILQVLPLAALHEQAASQTSAPAGPSCCSTT
eukprot:1160827-Pelagomonas_calceolata.AAC.9